MATVKTMIFIGTYFRSYESPQGPASRQGGQPGFLKGTADVSVRPGVCSGPLHAGREKMVRSLVIVSEQ